MTKSASFIPIVKPCLGDPEIKAVQRTIESGWVTQGPEVQAFENEFAAYVGAPYACAVSNCTTALHLALLMVGVQAGDEVITVSHSFIATTNSILYLKAKPVFVDIEPRTFNVDAGLIEKAITKKTRAILCVHQIGMPCNLREIKKIAEKHSLALIEDAACAIGSEMKWNDRWEKIGKPHGDIACFSFHPRKVITTGDGGMLTTSNADWDRSFRLLRQHGMNVSDKIRHQGKEVVFESYDVLGYNYRMTDMQAAMGREQLKRLPEMIKRRRELAARYHMLLGNLDISLTLPEEPSWARSNWQSYQIGLPEKCDQRGVMQRMLDKGVATRRGIMNAHREPSLGNVAWSAESLVESEKVQDHCILLPLYVELSDSEQDKVIDVFHQACLEDLK